MKSLVNYNSSRISALVLMLFFIAAFAKTGSAQDENGELPGSQVRVEKLFDARLADAKRVELAPSFPTLDTTRVSQRYEVVAAETNIQYAPPKIRPLGVKVNQPDDPYKGFARAGVGFPLGWIGDIGYVTQNDQIALRGDAHTYGFNGPYNENQNYAEVDARIGATYYAPAGLAIDFDLDYDRSMFEYYGFSEAVNDTTIELPAALLQQHFGNFGVSAGFRNAKPNEIGVDYYAKIGFDILSDNFASKERSTRIQLGGRKDFGEQWYAEADIDLDLSTFDADIEQSLNNYQFKPIVGSHFDDFGFRAGATIANSRDTFSFFPAIELTYAVGGGIVVMAGADGGLRKNDYRTLTDYLPFLVRDPQIRNAEEYRFYAAVQGQTRGVNYKATASYSRINNLALFMQDDSLLYQFRPTYDTANVITLRLEANMPIAEKLNGQLLIENRNFSLRNAEKPFLLPSFDAQLRLGYEVTENLNVDGLLVVQNALPFALPNQTDTSSVDFTDFTGALFDFSLHGKYQINDRLGAFAQMNNLFNNRRRKFPFYPTLGTNVLVGLTARF